jgi:hypothetical protein
MAGLVLLDAHVVEGLIGYPGYARTPHGADTSRNVVGVDSRAEVLEFLASRRAKITPLQSGRPLYGSNRRFPGLRCEEVVLIADASTDCYTPPGEGEPDRRLGRRSRRAATRRRRTGPTLNYDALELPADPGQTIIAYTGEAGSAAQDALSLLASWAPTQDQPSSNVAPNAPAGASGAEHHNPNS